MKILVLYLVGAVLIASSVSGAEMIGPKRILDRTEDTVDMTFSPEPEPTDDVTDITPTPALDDTCEDAERACKFEIKGTTDELPTFSIPRLPDRAFTPDIVSKNPKEFIGVVNSNIEGEFIEDDGDVVLFSRAIPRGARIAPFSKSLFKPFFPSKGGNFSGIGHESFQRGQLKFARGKCVRVFITEWQVFFADGTLKDNVNGKTNKRDNFCVVFRTK